MRRKNILSYIFIICGISLMSYSVTHYLRQVLERKAPLDEQRKMITKNYKQDITEISWIRYPDEERPQRGEQFADLIIPQLDVQLPVIEGTEDNHLLQGVGHYEKSVLPGEPDNVVLSAHRDTFFKGIGVLRKGDKLGIKTKKGLFVYEVTKHWITDPDDRGVIVPHKNPILTLTTCYPFTYVGMAPKRYIVQSVLRKKINL